VIWPFFLYFWDIKEDQWLLFHAQKVLELVRKYKLCSKIIFRFFSNFSKKYFSKNGQRLVAEMVLSGPTRVSNVLQGMKLAWWLQVNDLCPKTFSFLGLEKSTKNRLGRRSDGLRFLDELGLNGAIFIHQQRGDAVHPRAWQYPISAIAADGTSPIITRRR
jgi:hypothetical protein